MDYGEFNGPNCVCAPAGWNMVVGSEEIDNVSDYAGGGCTTNVESESPTGGSFVALNIIGSNPETITTTVTGLTAGETYTLQFWWMSVEYVCGGSPVICCSDLEVIADGVTYTFPAADDWELAEICLVADEDGLDIELSGTLNSNQGHIIVDNIDCEEVESSCCALELELEEEINLCPDEDGLINAIVSNAQGNINFEWSCDPDEGLDFLSDTDELNPTFNYPHGQMQFGGATFTYTLEVSDEVCDVEEDITINVLEIIEPTFDFTSSLFCSVDGQFVFPTTSNEGISGSWTTPSIFLEDFGGMEFTNTFMPSAGQLSCPIPTDHTMEITEFVMPSFDFPLEFCISEVDYFEFPEESLEGIEGNWNIEALVEGSIQPGEINLLFTPFEDFCTDNLEQDIYIQAAQEISFDIRQDYCRQDSTFELPDESLEQFEGNWMPESIDLNQSPGTYSAIFTPDEDDCIDEYEFFYTINDDIESEFDFPDSICRTSSIYILDSISLNGIPGNWIPDRFDPDTVSSNFTTALWVPDKDSVACAVDIVFEFRISAPGTPEFIIPTQFCQEDSVFILG